MSLNVCKYIEQVLLTCTLNVQFKKMHNSKNSKNLPIKDQIKLRDSNQQETISKYTRRSVKETEEERTPLHDARETCSSHADDFHFFIRETSMFYKAML